MKWLYDNYFNLLEFNYYKNIIINIIIIIIIIHF